MNAPGAEILLHPHRHAALPDVLHQLEDGVLPGPDLLSVNAYEEIPVHDAGRVRGAPRRDVSDGRPEARHSDHEHQPVDGQREHDVEERPHEDDEEALPDRLEVELVLKLLLLHLTLGAVEHLHIAAERYGRNRPLGAVTVLKGAENLAEAQGEAEDLHAAETRGDEVSVLVHCYQDGNREEEAEHRPDNVPDRAQDHQ